VFGPKNLTFVEGVQVNTFNHKAFSRKGGLARAKNLTHEEIQEIGRRGGIESGKVRWKKAQAQKAEAKKHATTNKKKKKKGKKPKKTE
jgi:general stress protein YciG